MRLPVAAAGVLLGLCLGGCRSAPAVYYTLVPPERVANPSSNTPPAARVVLVMRPVPVEIDTTRILVRAADSAMRVAEAGLWTSPFADEVKAALGDGLRQRFGMLVVTDVRPGDVTLPRIDLTLHKFDAIEGTAVSIVAAWSLSMPRNSGTDRLSCQSVLTVRAGGGVDGVVAASQTAILELADAIGTAVRAASAGATPACG